MVQIRKGVPGFPLLGWESEAGWEPKSQSPRGFGHFPAHSLSGRGWEGLLQRENRGFPASRGYSLTERVSIGNAHSSDGSVVASLVGTPQPLAKKWFSICTRKNLLRAAHQQALVARDLYPLPPMGVEIATDHRVRCARLPEFLRVQIEAWGVSPVTGVRRLPPE